MLVRDWNTAPPVPHKILRRYKMHPILAQVLHNRGFQDPKEAFVFLTAGETDDYGRFSLSDMSDMEKAVQRTARAIKRREKIVVYGDFDADGVTSTALMMQMLRLLGAIVEPYIPHRVDEGYGLNSAALRELARRGVGLVITVDCGIRSVQEVADGNKAGLDIIITDHHSVGQLLPEAYAVVNPKRDTASTRVEPMLAGVGVSYLFATALLHYMRAKKMTEVDFEPRQLLDLVAIGTVADLVPLNREMNRLLVRRGLRVLQQAQRPGVRALMEVSGVEPDKVNATSIGYSLGPRINAAGRLADAKLAYKLLFTDDEAQARELAAELQKLNVARQELTREAQEIVRHEIESNGHRDEPLIFASSPAFEHGIVGLVAGRLVEEYYRPAVIVRQGEQESTASCRSIPQFDITHALDQCADLLIRHGGHAQAAGLTVANDKLDVFREMLMEIAADSLAGRDLRPSIHIDVEVGIHQLDEPLVDELRHLEPTGHDNPAPVLMSSDVYVTDYRLVGRDQSHLKLRIARAGQAPIDAIGFNLGEWASQMPERIDVAYHLEINEWNDRRSLQLNLKDIRPAEGL